MEFLQQNMKESQTLGFDGRVIPTKEGCEYEKKLAEKKVKFSIEEDLAEAILGGQTGISCR